MMDLLLRRRMMMIRQSGGPTPLPNQIWYDANSQVTLSSTTNVVSHTFADGRGVITFDSDITTVRDWLRGTAVTNVYLPSGVTLIYDYAFTSCSSLAFIELPSSITKIKRGAFTSCSSLALTELPSSITSIDNYAFSSCRGIISLTIPIVTPPTCTTTSFYGTTFPIYVPAESVEAYKAADGWSEYASRIYPIT